MFFPVLQETNLTVLVASRIAAMRLCANASSQKQSQQEKNGDPLSTHLCSAQRQVIYSRPTCKPSITITRRKHACTKPVHTAVVSCELMDATFPKNTFLYLSISIPDQKPFVSDLVKLAASYSEDFATLYI